MKQSITQKIRQFSAYVLTFFLAVAPYVASASSHNTGGGGGGGGGSERAWYEVFFLDYWISQLAEMIFRVVGWVTALLGQIMNWTIEFFILDMSTYINDIEAVDSLWQILRDLGNIVFIFLILYAAISIILGSDRNAKEILPRVIVVALLVNFSLFATQFIVDTSNVFALQIYENIDVSGVDSSSAVNISNAIMNQTNLTTLSSGEGLTAIQESTSEDFMLTTLFLISAVVMGIVGFVFAAFAALITIRFFVLMLLMIGSPLIFIGFALPNVSFGEDWFEWLISQSFFAPAMMLMLYITLVLGKSMKESDLFAGSNLAEAITEIEGNIDILIFYALMIGMLIASLLVAKRMGAVGADKTVSTGKSISDWGRAKVTSGAAGATAGTAAYAGRTSFGRGGRAIADSERLKRYESEGGFKGYLAQQARRAGEATAGSSFDVRNTSAVEGGGDFNRREGGFDEAIQDQKEFRDQREESIRELSPDEKEKAEKAKVARNELKDKREDLSDDLSDINSTFNDIEQLQKEKRVARAEGRGEDYINDLDEKIADKIDNIKDDIDEETYEALGVDTGEGEDDDGELPEFKESIENPEQLDEIRDSVEEVIEDAGEEMKRLEEQHIKKGEKRAEAYQEAMLEQKSLLDSKYFDTNVTTKTKGNRRYGINNISNIESNEEFRQNIENEMAADVNNSVELSDTPGTADSRQPLESDQPEIDEQLKQELENVPTPPQEYENKLSEALDEASKRLETMLDAGTDEAIDNMNELLDTAKGSPYVRGVGSDGNIQYQDFDESGNFTEMQSGTPDDLAQRREQDGASLESSDEDTNDDE
jgi:hypothetical protein